MGERVTPQGQCGVCSFQEPSPTGWGALISWEAPGGPSPFPGEQVPAGRAQPRLGITAGTPWCHLSRGHWSHNSDLQTGKTLPGMVWGEAGDSQGRAQGTARCHQDLLFP